MTELEQEEENKKYKTKLNFQDFDKIKVSTKTFVVMTNISLDIDNLFKALPISDYVIIPKKRGRKKKTYVADPNKDIPSGSIITLEYKDDIRGVDLKKKSKKKSSNRRNYFRNSVTIVMIIDDKKINFKVSRNGKFQMTGCKYDEQAERCVLYIWKYIKDLKDIYSIKENPEEKKNDNEIFSAMFIPAMRNIDFSINFLVDRKKLDEYFNMNTDYHSLLETSFGYTGVNIKIPIKKHINKLPVKQLTFCTKKETWSSPEYITYKEYLKHLPEKEQQKKNKKARYNTFLVFHSGKIIMSGIEASFMRDTYYEFLDIIRDCYHIIEEKLD